MLCMLGRTLIYLMNFAWLTINGQLKNKITLSIKWVGESNLFDGYLMNTFSLVQKVWNFCHSLRVALKPPRGRTNVQNSRIQRSTR